MSIPAESVARLICEACGITRDLDKKRENVLSKTEMLMIYPYIVDIKIKLGEALQACKLAGVDKDLIETMKRFNLLGKADGK